MTTNNKKKNNNIKKRRQITTLLLSALILVGVISTIAIYKHVKNNPGGAPTSPGPGLENQTASPSPQKDPVWHENKAPETKQVSNPPDTQYPYYIKVNRALCTVTVYQMDETGAYTVPVKAFACSVGKAGEETILGEYSMPEAYDWCYMVDGTYSQFAYRIHNGYMFHSVPCVEMEKNTLETEEYNKLGGPASLGCIRLTVADAKWIYDNCPAGTKTEIYDDTESPGPLGKPDTIKIPLGHEYASWDPTDPDSSNPWKNCAPKIEASDISVPAGTEADIFQGVKAYDTCGNDITEKLYWYGRYTCDIAGTYQITYGVVDAIGKSCEKSVTLTVTEGTNQNMGNPTPTALPSANPASVQIDQADITSQYAFLICRNSGEVLLDKNSQQRVQPASLTKIMTVLLAAESFSNFEETLVITEQTFEYLKTRDASMSKLPIGTPIRIIDLLYGSFLPSGADASVTLANKIAGSETEFARLMNQKAAGIGMKDTHFVNATGLTEEDQYTSCRDMALLLEYALQNPLFRKIYMTETYTTAPLPNYPNGVALQNTMFHLLPEMPLENGLRIAGGKTGYTDAAGLCLASYAISVKNEYLLVTTKAAGSYWDEPYPNHIKDALTIYSSIQEGDSASELNAASKSK